MTSPEAGAPGSDSPLGAFMKPLGRRFALTYAAISAALFSVYCFPYQYVGVSERGFELYLGGYARLVGVVLRLFGENVTVEGTRIEGRFPLEIVKNCDAMEIMILLSGAILAVPAPVKRRVQALCVGLAAVVVMNVVRIVGLYYVGVHAPGGFEAMHGEVFPLVLVAFAALLFLLTLGWLDASRGAKVNAPRGTA